MVWVQVRTAGHLLEAAHAGVGGARGERRGHHARGGGRSVGLCQLGGHLQGELSVSSITYSHQEQPHR